MTDQELLERAAKAAGAHATAKHAADGAIYVQWRPNLRGYSTWAPLTDDGDALRLAVRLRMEIGFAGDHVAAQRTGGKLMTEQRRDGDVQAATRRAIVRVAAQALEIANFQAPGAAQGAAE